MAGSRRIGNMTIHFVGDKAAQLESMFGDAYSGSESFRNAMRETASTYRNIYVGSTLADLREQPNFDEAGFRPDSKDVTDKAAFGKAAGAETYFIGVTGREHTLKHSGQSFAGSSLLALVHEFLHPTQITRELAATGKVEHSSEARTQMREQTIAAELGKTPGKDFPDVIGSDAPYDVQLNSPGTQPQSVRQGDPALPVDPTKYEGPSPPEPAQLASQRQADSISAPKNYDTPNARVLSRRVVARDADGNIGSRDFYPTGTGPMNPTQPAPPPQAGETLGIPSSKPVRYLGRKIADQSQASVFDTAVTAPSDRQDLFGDRFGNWTSSSEGIPPRNPNLPVPPPESGGPLGIFSGKPMPLWTTPLPLGRLLDNSAASGNDDRNWLTTLGGITSENSTPPAPPEQIGGSKPVRYLGRGIVDPPQALVFDAGAPAVPLVPSDDPNFSGGLPGRLAAVLVGIGPENPDQPVPQPGGLLGLYLSSRR
jgi:hypothetical protein